MTINMIKSTLKSVYRTKSRRIVKKPKQCIVEIRYSVISISGCLINKAIASWNVVHRHLHALKTKVNNHHI